MGRLCPRKDRECKRKCCLQFTGDLKKKCNKKYCLRDCPRLDKECKQKCKAENCIGEDCKRFVACKDRIGEDKNWCEKRLCLRSCPRGDRECKDVCREKIA